ncbi:hypothetical protein LEMLEM_LOCUS18723, partial [Lemmus lemmus]
MQDGSVSTKPTLNHPTEKSLVMGCEAVTILLFFNLCCADASSVLSRRLFIVLGRSIGTSPTQNHPTETSLVIGWEAVTLPLFFSLGCVDAPSP